MSLPSRLLVAGLLLTPRCGTATGPSLVTIDEPFDLAVGGSAQVEGGPLVEVETVENDSRCPRDATCIWAGDAEIRLSVVAPGSGRVRGVATLRGNVLAAGPYAVRALGLRPETLQGRSIDLKDYVVTLAVSTPRPPSP